jgi:hypothetical protein
MQSWEDKPHRPRRCILPREGAGPALFEVGRAIGRINAMKDFSNAAFPPEVIESMTNALEQVVATLPEPVHSVHVNLLAESILRSAKAGERDPLVLQRLALLELQIAPRA